MKLVKGFYFPDYDNACSGAVFRESRKIRKVLNLCSNFDAVIQAGGNVGVFAVELAKRFNHVHCYEPDPRNWECLIKNTIGISNVHCLKMGLSNVQGEGSIYQPDNADNCGSLAVREGDGDVAITTLDSLNIQHEVGLIYLDVEGAEYRALMGAQNIIKQHEPVIVAENKGFISEFTNTGFLKGGSPEFREWLCNKFDYVHVARFQRDDVFMKRSD